MLVIARDQLFCASGRERQATSRKRRKASLMISLVVVCRRRGGAGASIAAGSSGSILTGTTSAGPDPMVVHVVPLQSLNVVVGSSGSSAKCVFELWNG